MRLGRRFMAIKWLLAAAFMPMLLMLLLRNQRDDEDLMVKMQRNGPLAYNDPRLLRVVLQSYIQPPSTLSSNLVIDQENPTLNSKKYLQYQYEFAYGFCRKVIKSIFQEVRGGFFVEAGALDGEFLSNTLPLERESNWTGLLVESDGDMFGQLLKKQRKSWASHSCLAIHPHPHRETIIKFVGHDRQADQFSMYSARAHGVLMGVAGGATLDNTAPGHQVFESVQCLPLATLLLALNITRVDLVSLDVEGAEVGVLRHFPWGHVTVDVWVVEHVKPESKTQFIPESNEPPPTISAHKTKREAHPSGPVNNTTKGGDIDPDFVAMFTSRGYELYSVSEDLLILNYAFILRTSEHYKRLKGINKRINT